MTDPVVFTDPERRAAPVPDPVGARCARRRGVPGAHAASTARRARDDSQTVCGAHPALRPQGYVSAERPGTHDVEGAGRGPCEATHEVIPHRTRRRIGPAAQAAPPTPTTPRAGTRWAGAAARRTPAPPSAAGRLDFGPRPMAFESRRSDEPTVFAPRKKRIRIDIGAILAGLFGIGTLVFVGSLIYRSTRVEVDVTGLEDGAALNAQATEDLSVTMDVGSEDRARSATLSFDGKPVKEPIVYGTAVVWKPESAPKEGEHRLELAGAAPGAGRRRLRVGLHRRQDRPEGRGAAPSPRRSPSTRAASSRARPRRAARSRPTGATCGSTAKAGSGWSSAVRRPVRSRSGRPTGRATPPRSR